MAIQIRPEDAIDRGQPNRRLTDGTHEATIVTCEQYMKNSLSLKVEVVAHPKDTKAAPEGPVLLSTYLPLEITDKVRDLSRATNFVVACGGKPGDSIEERDQVGKAVRVITRWTPSKDAQFRDRAEISGFLPPLPGQKPNAALVPPPAATTTDTPF